MHSSKCHTPTKKPKQNFATVKTPSPQPINHNIAALTKQLSQIENSVSALKSTKVPHLVEVIRNTPRVSYEEYLDEQGNTQTRKKVTYLARKFKEYRLFEVGETVPSQLFEVGQEVFHTVSELVRKTCARHQKNSKNRVRKRNTIRSVF